MSAQITLIGNEGFHVATESVDVLVDPFYGAIPGVAGPAAFGASDVSRADLILVTHAHWDHFEASEVADVANRTGAKVIGPEEVANRLRTKVSADALVVLEPPLRRNGEEYASDKVELPTATVTAFRTSHGRVHNSYLVNTFGFRFFHDGDNEDTRRLNVSAIQPLDALLIGPWHGSGWVEFIEAVAAKHYFLMHLTDDELDEIDAGTFLPAICDHVPEGLVVLRPGQSFAFD